MIFAVRHTERADRIPKPPPVKIPYDPHLTETGLVQARRTGKKILETIDAHIEPDEIIIYTSPFLRCVQTAAQIRKEIVQAYPHKTTKLILNNIITESLITRYFEKDPHDDLFIKTQSQAQIEELLENQDVNSELETEFGHPDFPELKAQAYARIELGFTKILDKHFGKADTPAVICITHAFGIIGFAKVFKDTDYDGMWSYGCISACRVFKSKESEVVLSSYQKHVDDLLVEYNLHAPKKVEKKGEEEKGEESKVDK